MMLDDLQRRPTTQNWASSVRFLLQSLGFNNVWHFQGVGDKKVQVGKDQEKAQSEKDSHSKNRGGEKKCFTMLFYRQLNNV